MQSPSERGASGWGRAVVPARLSAGVAQLGRDLRAIVDGFRGVRPASFQQRAARPSATPGRALVIDEVVRETADAVSLWLVDPAGAPIHFTPGQFLTVLTTLDGVELRRAYSPSSSASAPGRVRVTIKRVAGGRVSSYLHEAARVGGRLRVLGPSGAFTLSDDARGRDLVLIAG
ncbi:MAG: hypothetical protein KC636_15590, partial [Myxococcales bacterium]|nr:hypothetical protein [Myxococcales bacterium]